MSDNTLKATLKVTGGRKRKRSFTSPQDNSPANLVIFKNGEIDQVKTAIRTNDLDRLKRSLKRTDINEKDENGRTLLLYAAYHRCKKVSIFRYLINQGVDVEAVDNDGYRACDYVTVKTVLQLLCEKCNRPKMQKCDRWQETVNNKYESSNASETETGYKFDGKIHRDRKGNPKTNPDGSIMQEPPFFIESVDGKTTALHLNILRSKNKLEPILVDKDCPQNVDLSGSHGSNMITWDGIVFYIVPFNEALKPKGIKSTKEAPVLNIASWMAANKKCTGYGKERKYEPDPIAAFDSRVVKHIKDTVAKHVTACHVSKTAKTLKVDFTGTPGITDEAIQDTVDFIHNRDWKLPKGVTNIGELVEFYK